MHQVNGSEPANIFKHHLSLLTKEAKKLLKDAGHWDQGFHRHEIRGVFAVFQAIENKRMAIEQALGLAVESLQDYEQGKPLTEEVLKETLEAINQIVLKESREETKKRIKKLS